MVVAWRDLGKSGSAGRAWSRSDRRIERRFLAGWHLQPRLAVTPLPAWDAAFDRASGWVGGDGASCAVGGAASRLGAIALAAVVVASAAPVAEIRRQVRIRPLALAAVIEYEKRIHLFFIVNRKYVILIPLSSRKKRTIF